MTNLEWIRTLSEEEFADWLYDEWLHHLQYRWSSSRGGLIIWLKDRKTENSSEKPNNSKEKPNNSKVSEKPTGSTRSKMEQVDKDINVRSKDKPQICDTCRYYNSNIPCGSTPSACKEADKFAEEFVDGLKKLKPKDEPQTCSFSDCDNFKNPDYARCIECKRKQIELKTEPNSSEIPTGSTTEDCSVVEERSSE